ncbi:MAG: 2-C-methyl-D-erythritol 4-phosphate cytidylyltransferase [Deltaproteobacteria bacterium]|nr:2-C-methyl-D-erythritol 4-phosphate cytidylyltransferase [Deltaproteobacteria bacterium]
MISAAAIIPAAGCGTRFGGGQAKQFFPLLGRPLVEYSLAAFERAKHITEVVLVVAESHLAGLLEQLAPRFQKLRAVVAGGPRRQDSVCKGLEALSCRDDTVVTVHDGARPLIRPAMIDRCVEVAAETGGCIVACPVNDTVKRVKAGDVIEATMDRTALWLAQTPQAFRYGVLLDALRQADRDGVTGTDEAALVERRGGAVRVLLGDAWNLKITTQEDLAIAEALMRQEVA